MHDDITQRLAQLAIETGSVNLRQAPAAIQEKIREVRDGLRRVSDDVHSLAYNLHPAFLEHLDLPTALKTECACFSRNCAISISVKIGDVSTAISRDAKFCLFRITQEGLNNIRRHSGANTAQILLRQIDNRVQLSITDNGSGFDLNAANRKPSLGLKSMEERTRLLAGRFEIRSNPGHGTIIFVEIPLMDCNLALPAANG